MVKAFGMAGLNGDKNLTNRGGVYGPNRVWSNVGDGGQNVHQGEREKHTEIRNPKIHNPKSENPKSKFQSSTNTR